MNETMKAILERRSIRSFTDQKIPVEDLKTIVDAARYAPTAMNRQLCQFTVIQNKDAIEKLAAAIRAELGREKYDFYKPDCMILASTPRDCVHGVEDCACALENMFLAAHSLGIGSVWINQLRGICDAPKIRPVLTELEIPVSHLIHGMAALGYAAEPAPAAVKKENVQWIL